MIFFFLPPLFVLFFVFALIVLATSRVASLKGVPCVVTGAPAKYLDPATQLPYASSAAFAELRAKSPSAVQALQQALQARIGGKRVLAPKPAGGAAAGADDGAAQAGATAAAAAVAAPVSAPAGATGAAAAVGATKKRKHDEVKASPPPPAAAPVNNSVPAMPAMPGSYAPGAGVPPVGPYGILQPVGMPMMPMGMPMGMAQMGQMNHAAAYAYAMHAQQQQQQQAMGLAHPHMHLAVPPHTSPVPGATEDSASPKASAKKKPRVTKAAPKPKK